MNNQEPLPNHLNKSNQRGSFVKLIESSASPPSTPGASSRKDDWHSMLNLIMTALFLGKDDSCCMIYFSCFRMIGEFDYDSLFFGEDSENHSLAILPYRTVTLIFFLAFMLIVPIIIMNLLVSKS